MSEENQKTMVTGWLRDVSAALGVELSLDEEGICTIQVGEDQIIAIEVSEDFPIVQLYTPLLGLPLKDKEAAFSLMVKAMEMNAFQALTQGGALALAPNTQLIIYSLSLPVEGMDSDVFGKVLVQFRDTGMELKEALSDSSKVSADSTNDDKKNGKMIFKM